MRVKIIHQLIKNGVKDGSTSHYPKAEELLKECNESLKDFRPIDAEDYKILTIYRDIQFMKKVFNAPIEYDTLEKGYYYYGKNFTLSLE